MRLKESVKSPNSNYNFCFSCCWLFCINWIQVIHIHVHKELAQYCCLVYQSNQNIKYTLYKCTKKVNCLVWWWHCDIAHFWWSSQVHLILWCHAMWEKVKREYNAVHVQILQIQIQVHLMLMFVQLIYTPEHNINSTYVNKVIVTRAVLYITTVQLIDQCHCYSDYTSIWNVFVSVCNHIWKSMTLINIGWCWKFFNEQCCKVYILNLVSTRPEAKHTVQIFFSICTKSNLLHASIC